MMSGPEEGYKMIKPGVYKKINGNNGTQENTVDKKLHEAYVQLDRLMKPPQKLFEYSEPPKLRKSILSAQFLENRLISSTPYFTRSKNFLIKSDSSISPIPPREVSRRQHSVKSNAKNTKYEIQNNINVIPSNEQQNNSTNCNENNPLQILNEQSNRSYGNVPVKESCVATVSDQKHVRKQTAASGKKVLASPPSKIQIESFNRNSGPIRNKNNSILSNGLHGNSMRSFSSESGIVVLGSVEPTKSKKETTKENSSAQKRQNSKQKIDRRVRKTGSRTEGQKFNVNDSDSSNDSAVIEMVYSRQHNIFESLQEGDEMRYLNFSDSDDISVPGMVKPWRFDNGNLCDSKPDCSVKLNFIRSEQNILNDANQRQGYNDSGRDSEFPIEDLIECYTKDDNNKSESRNSVMLTPLNETDSFNGEMEEYQTLKKNPKKPSLLNCNKEEKLRRCLLVDSIVLGITKHGETECTARILRPKKSIKQYTVSEKRIVKEANPQNKCDNLICNIPLSHKISPPNDNDNVQMVVDENISHVDPSNTTARKNCQKTRVRNTSRKLLCRVSLPEEGEVPIKRDILSPAVKNSNSTEIKSCLKNTPKRHITSSYNKKNAHKKIGSKKMVKQTITKKYATQMPLKVSLTEITKFEGAVQSVNQNKKGERQSNLRKTVQNSGNEGAAESGTFVTAQETEAGRPRRQRRPVRFKTDLVFSPLEIDKTHLKTVSKNLKATTNMGRKSYKMVSKKKSYQKKNASYKSEITEKTAAQNEASNLIIQTSNSSQKASVENCLAKENKQAESNIIEIEMTDYCNSLLPNQTLNNRQSEKNILDNMSFRNLETPETISNIEKPINVRRNPVRSSRKGNKIQKKTKTKGITKGATKTILKVLENTVNCASMPDSNLSNGPTKSRSHLLLELMQNSCSNSYISEPKFILKHPEDFQKVGNLEVSEVFINSRLELTTSVGYIKIQPGKSKPMSTSMTYIINFSIVKGEAFVIYNGEEGLVRQGQSFIVLIGDEYCIKNAKQTDLVLRYMKIQENL